MMGRYPQAGLLATLAALYFAQGLPLGLLSKALPALARDAGLPLPLIGLLALPALPWALKFAWAPWVDRIGRGQRGHRLRWISSCQLLAVSMLVLLSFLSPEWLFGAGFLALLLAIFLLNLLFATHDIASDGLATRCLTASLRGPGNSIQFGGYKLGWMLGGAAFLYLVDGLGWQLSLALLALSLLLLLLPVQRFPEPPYQGREEPGVRLGWRGWLRQFAGFLARPGVSRWVLVLVGYKVGDSFGSRMIQPYLVDAGWTLADIGTLGLVASLCGLAGAGVAGLLMLQLPRRAALAGFALLQALAFLGWALLPAAAPQAMVYLVACFEQFADAMATVALFTLMMDLCRDQHEGSDYTLQASTLLMSSGLFSLVSGVAASLSGYSLHFALSAALSLLVILPVLSLPAWIVHDKR